MSDIPGTALALGGLTKRFGRVSAVDDFDLSVRDAELVALVGPSGCGKSTLLRLVAGLERPDAGEIRIGGEPVAGPTTFCPPERRRVGIVLQDHALFPHLSVAANIAFGLNGRPAGRRRERVGEVLELVSMTGHARRYPHELSGGEQQRVALARALAPEPVVLLLDEPFSNLDRNLRIQIREDTIAILEAAGVTVVLVTHDQQEALAIGDRVAVMREGRVEQVGRPDHVFHGPANRFVARFMGDADFLPARLDAGHLVTEAGVAPAPPGLPADSGRDGQSRDQGKAQSKGQSSGAGRELEVMVRPHEVGIRPDPVGASKVVGIEFQGAFHLYRVLLPSGRTLRSLCPHTAEHPVGSRVEVTLTHGHPPTVVVGDRTVASAYSPR